ncbi:MAG: alpha-E domain-containing protein [Flavobacterium sp.]|uniref:alpha-E domain-containing protein n=1 Tax=Flavobacterium sp. TaxID=239 RepID=UPI001211E441|nr:alpha-E domain-containing protein [Flavobacterium sp.]RZJ63284.1 MAG: alpha-E domain-containing protein [Flavobacterium sp.]
MLSRVAENIFWMSRYMERTNIHLRSLQSVYIASQDGTPILPWEDLCKQYHFSEDEMCAEAGQVLRKIVFDSSLDASLVNNVFRARENARSAQDHITKELWQSFNDFHHLMRDENLKFQIEHRDPITVLDQLIRQCMLYYGIVSNSMFRLEGYYFLRIGELIERALFCLMLLERQLLLTDMSKPDSADATSWRYLLISLSGYEYYLRSNAGSLNPESIYKQILFEQDFPHSILYALNQIHVFCRKLNQDSHEDSHSQVGFLLGKTIAHVKFTDAPGTTKDRIAFLETIRAHIYQLIGAFDEQYFKVVY